MKGGGEEGERRGGEKNREKEKGEEGRKREREGEEGTKQEGAQMGAEDGGWGDDDKIRSWERTGRKRNTEDPTYIHIYSITPTYVRTYTDVHVHVQVLYCTVVEMEILYRKCYHKTFCYCTLLQMVTSFTYFR